MSLIDSISAEQDELAQWRRALHANPEIGFAEQATASFVASKLESFGLAVHTQIGGTGVVGVLNRGNETRAVGLRADMDALPLQEHNHFDHRSKNDGVMHACGHDGHTVMLLAAARYLADSDKFRGTVNFIFQPAEEGLGGAKAMIADGLFEQFPCDVLYALHNAPGLPVGTIAASTGTVTAAGAFFDIKVIGRGAHGAFPDHAIDPVVLAAELINSLQSIVSRNVRPKDVAVLSITQVHAGDAYNVIPNEASLAGTVRTFSTKVMEKIEQRVRAIADGLALAHGATIEVDFRTVFHPVVNDAEAAATAVRVAQAMVGEAKVECGLPPGTGSEDFSFMLEQVPGAYLLLGNGDAPDSHPVHHPEYDFNDDAIGYGASLFAKLVEHELAPG